VLRGLPIADDPNLLVGIETADDAGIYRLPDGTMVVQTVDFFTPIVDDPYTFGAVAAANAMSDVYAMGGRPLTALNIVCFPIDKIPAEVLSRILLGGYDKVREAGAVVVGGHSLDDKEPKFGAAITGIVDPEQFITNSSAKPGQRVILTKPIGTAAITTAGKADACPQHALDEACEWMLKLNREASEVAVRHGIRAGTDVTGFGLAGHLSQIARASNVSVRIAYDRIPLLPEAERLAAEEYVPAGTSANAIWLTDMLERPPHFTKVMLDILCDPQTSGGLALCVDPDRVEAVKQDLEFAAEIGTVEEGPPRIVVE
jgi:selenide,water dikinase